MCAGVCPSCVQPGRPPAVPLKATDKRIVPWMDICQQVKHGGGGSIITWISFSLQQRTRLYLLCRKTFFNFSLLCFLSLCSIVSEIDFGIHTLFLVFSVGHCDHLHSFSPFHPLPHFVTFLCMTESGRRPEIDVRPVRAETGSWLNRSDRSGTEHLRCQTAGPLWMEIISKLLQEADACQKMLSVKVRLLQSGSLRLLSLPPSHFFCFLNSSA